jgi:uncharacterized protein YcbX
MITVSQLNIYPVKSCRGVSLNAVTLDDRGPVNDRRWMLTDQEGVFLTQREKPRLSLVSVQVTDSGIVLSAPGMPPLAVDAPIHDDGADFVTKVWDDTVRVRPADPEAGRWFTQFLGTPAQLVFLPDDAARVMRDEYSGDIRESRRVTLTDGAPLLLISEESLADLNSRLADPLPMNRFRPSVVVRGGGKFAEDSWKRIAIGEVIFEVAKPCARCATTTVDQATGVRGKEPLRTLATFRKVGSEVMFGQNIAHHAPGELRVGMDVRVIN